ncbi:GntR family transcriptional regulator [Novosphingobium terrae]|uniref:hypothetical protein n=1 Tax=Novosphingobium terrae TaxID=2726189 RepID=UPI002AC354AA|nr:hypothetical protein [Novosphingobium terrae]
MLADELGSSPTPIRDAMHILAGEDIVIAGATGGFTIPMIDQPSLIDLYGWNADILGAALRNWRPSHQPERTLAPSATGETPIAERISQLFLHIAHRSVNIEHPRALGRINERLYAVRQIESQIISNTEDEILEIRAHLHAGDVTNIKKWVTRYTKRRQSDAGNIIHNLYRSDAI